MEIGEVIWMFITLILLLAFSAFFSSSETALMAVSRLRLKHIAEERPRKVRLVEKVLVKPERLIGTILLGNNLVNVAMTALATSLAISIWEEKGIAYVTVVLTIAILIFAEITPKVYAKYYNEKLSLLTAPILNVIMIVLSPFVTAVTYVSNKLLLLIGVDVSKIKRPLMTEAEIQTCIKMGWDEGAITEEEKKLLTRVFTLNDKSVRDIMIPFNEIVIIDADSSVENVKEVVLKTGHSRFPVKKREDSNITGFIHAKDLFALTGSKKSGSLEDIRRPAYFVPEDKKIDVLLRGFQDRKLHMAVVLDNRGEVSGLITLEDILEELVGSIRDEHD